MPTEQKVVPCLWFNGDAEDAVALYLSAFDNSRERNRSHYPTTGLADFQQDMAGKVLTIELELGGVRMTALNAGSEFRPTPMLSFIVNFDPSQDDDAEARLDTTWARLAEGGQVLMELGPYPFSRRYGWLQDRFGVAWQLMLTDPAGEPRPFIIPTFMFANDNVNRGKDALEFYASVFPDARVGTVVEYEEPQEEVVKGAVIFADFAVGEQWFAVMDSPRRHDFDFNEGVSLQIECADQAEIDYFWDKLSTVPEAEVCGWCKDRFGVSWQVVPRDVERLLAGGGFAAMLKMKKIVIDELENARSGAEPGATG